MGNVAIRVEHLGKRYTLGHAPGSALRRALAGLRPRRRVDDGRDGVVWALDDLSFEMKKGEAVGVIGGNGAGKSTLLKILARITRPTRGAFTLQGRVGSLLEVGSGFHPELTGRENVLLNGAILGMRRHEIARRLDAIVAFSGVEKFIDTPVKYYSSGMYVRLAFAVAAHMEPEILLMDEVLAVGDMAFRKKCVDHMSRVIDQGGTVLFVSHNLAAVSSLCPRAVWIDAGRLRSDGESAEVIGQYLTTEAGINGERLWPEGMANPGVTEIALRAVRLRNRRGDVTATVDGESDFSIEVEYDMREALPACRIGVRIETVEGVTVMVGYDADDERFAGQRAVGSYTSRCVVPGRLLNPGRFVISVNAGIVGAKNLVKVDGALFFDINELGAVGSQTFGARSRPGLVRPMFTWDVEPVGRGQLVRA
jgi:lipopolysaccharide transport system ATP-binding protein